MLKRKDKKIYSDLHKSSCQIFLTEEDAKIAFENFDMKAFFHIVPLIALTENEYEELLSSSNISEENRV